MKYNNLEEVEYDLERLSLEKRIAYERFKGIKEDVKSDLSPYSWLTTVISAVKKYGMLYLIKKMIK